AEKPLPQLVEVQENRTTHKVKKGETLGVIARKYGVSISQLKQWNGLRSDRIQLGQTLKLFKKQSTKASTAVASTNSTPKSAISETSSEEVKTYKVRPGDSLWSITKKFPGLTVENIKKWNDISGDNIKAGTTIKISG